MERRPSVRRATRFAAESATLDPLCPSIPVRPSNMHDMLCVDGDAVDAGEISTLPLHRARVFREDVIKKGKKIAAKNRTKLQTMSDFCDDRVDANRGD